MGIYIRLRLRGQLSTFDRDFLGLKPQILLGAKPKIYRGKLSLIDM